MLENIFINVFGRSKSTKGSKNQPQTSVQPSQQPNAGMTGPFSGPSMPQPPSLPYPPLPYPPSASYYPQLPFSQQNNQPSPNSDSTNNDNNHQRTSSYSNHVSPLDSVPFETTLTLGSSSNLTSLDNLFRDIKQSADVVDRVDNYLKSNQSEYDFKIERSFLL